MATRGQLIAPTDSRPIDIKASLSLTAGTSYTLQVVSGQAIRIVEGADANALPGLGFWHVVPVTQPTPVSGSPVLPLWPIDVGADAIWVDLYDQEGPAAAISVTEAE